ncbi:unnamed protein product [Cylicocyclus nassatus]|uniref:Tc1-like transposase DDE domain-containing protein n=1 Tax=Cylicocyclus nassatus TaxID=53992 RepID=A0AA36M9Y3_CYLNA|nr:unnamed protein product [Cylicocyclus nassatus]
MLDCNEDFDKWIFTDESTVQVDSVVKYCYVKKGDYFSRLKSRAKHPAKLHLWGGISMRGATELAIFPGEIRLDGEKYCKILERCLLRFNNDAYHGYGKLVQDNAPSHKSSYTLEKLKSWKVDVVEWPPESPDLNPIELIWGSMKGHIRNPAENGESDCLGWSQCQGIAVPILLATYIRLSQIYSSQVYSLSHFASNECIISPFRSSPCRNCRYHHRSLMDLKTALVELKAFSYCVLQRWLSLWGGKEIVQTTVSFNSRNDVVLSDAVPRSPLCPPISTLPRLLHLNSFCLIMQSLVCPSVIHR